MSKNTAIRRKTHSAPLKYLLSSEHAPSKNKRILDYGCGHGADYAALKDLGYDVVGYDPHWRPFEPEGKFDVILCTYVLNVVNLFEERRILSRMERLLAPGGDVYITVRRDITGTAFTSRGLQRYVELTGPLYTKLKEKTCSFCIYHRKAHPLRQAADLQELLVKDLHLELEAKTREANRLLREAKAIEQRHNEALDGLRDLERRIYLTY